MANIFSTVRRALSPGISKEQLRQMDAALERQKQLCERSQASMCKYDAMLERTVRVSAEQTQALDSLLARYRAEEEAHASGRAHKLGA